MRIELNGESVQLEDGAPVSTAIQRAGVGTDERGVAVAVDGEVVPRSEWPARKLTDGQRVEVVGAIQGG